MCIPDHMTAQYFFFDTYVGYFLQILPIALLTGVGYYGYRRRNARHEPVVQTAMSALFMCYLAGLLSLTLFQKLIAGVYFFMAHKTMHLGDIPWFTFDYRLIPTVFSRFRAESLGNILLFLPFGILYPLSHKNSTWGRTVQAGVSLSVAIELLQPVVGRCFDSNDIILNSFGVCVSAGLFSAWRTVGRGRKHGAAQKHTRTEI